MHECTLPSLPFGFAVTRSPKRSPNPNLGGSVTQRHSFPNSARGLRSRINWNERCDAPGRLPQPALARSYVAIALNYLSLLGGIADMTGLVVRSTRSRMTRSDIANQSAGPHGLRWTAARRLRQWPTPRVTTKAFASQPGVIPSA